MKNGSYAKFSAAYRKWVNFFCSVNIATKILLIQLRELNIARRLRIPLLNGDSPDNTQIAVMDSYTNVHSGHLSSCYELYK